MIVVRLQVKMFQAGEFRTCWGAPLQVGQDGIGATLTGSLEPGEIVALEIPLPLTRPIQQSAHPSSAVIASAMASNSSSVNDDQRDTIQRVYQHLATNP